jgi:hypothetical protein
MERTTLITWVWLVPGVPDMFLAIVAHDSLIILIFDDDYSGFYFL